MVVTNGGGDRGLGRLSALEGLMAQGALMASP
jgi:hypothetical protein